MDKDVKPYKQRGNTCTIVCIMMVLEYYKKIEKANWYDERKLYKKYSSKYMAGTPFSAAAFELSKKGLNTTLFHSEKEIFTNKNKVIDENIFELALREYKEYLDIAKKVGTKVINGVEINSDFIKAEINKDNLVILAGELIGGYHSILITGYNNDNFIVCDPLYKDKQLVTKEELEQFMDTKIGKWCISVKSNN